MSDPCPTTSARLLTVLTLALALGCARSERVEVFNGERTDTSAEKGLVPGHVHLFELVQWGTPTGGIVATRLAERDDRRLALARLRVRLLEVKGERGVLEERELEIIRVKYTVDGWEKSKGKVKRPPNGTIERSTTMAPQQPGRPAHQVPAVIVEQYQEQMPREVVRSPDAARAFWAPKLAVALQELARARAVVDQAKAVAESGAAAASATPVQKTRVVFAVLPMRLRGFEFYPPHEPRGYSCDTCWTGARQHGSYVLAATGGVAPEPPAFADRAALERGVELTETTSVHGLDAGEAQRFDPKAGKLVLRLLGHCPVRLYQARQEVMVNPGYVIAIRKSVGFAEWLEMRLPECAGEEALRTQVTDLLAGAAGREEPEIAAEVRRLESELGFVADTVRRIEAMPVP